jgi:hypothetical protein
MHARGHDVRFVGAHQELARACVAPAGRRHPAAAAFQRENQVEHAASVAPAGDSLVLIGRRRSTPALDDFCVMAAGRQKSQP